MGVFPHVRGMSLASSLWVSLALVTPGPILLALAFVHRYRMWVYQDSLDRAVLLVFFAAVGCLAGLLTGLLLWSALRALDLVQRRVPRWALVVVALLLSVAWVGQLLRGVPLRLYSDPLFLGSISSAFAALLAAARGSRPWHLWDFGVILLAALLLLAAGGWLNLVVVRVSLGPLTQHLNALLLVGFFVLTGLAVLLGRYYPACCFEGAAIRPRHHAALLATAITAALLLVPAYRIAYAAGSAKRFASLWDARTWDTPSRVVLAAEEKRIPPGTVADQPQSTLPSWDSTGCAAPNIVLISLDTLRSDHLGLYGYPLNTSPSLDRFFADGVVFTHMYSQTPWTLPSHISMMTAQHPSAHGVRIHPPQVPGYVDRLPERAVTLAEVLRDEGYATAGYTGGGYLGRAYGFDQGFGTFEIIPTRRMREALNAALPWMRNASQPFFLFLHSFDPHRYAPERFFDEISEPEYCGPLRRMWEEQPDRVERLVVSDGFDELDERDIEFLQYLYDTEIRVADTELQRLFDELAALGFLDRTIVVFTSDHGENFAEHGDTGHGFNLYESVMRVPLMIRAPGITAPRYVATPVQTIDIAPTLLELVGAPPLPSTAGRSLLPLLLDREISPRAIILEADMLDTQAAIVAGGFKYISHSVLSHNLLAPRLGLLSLRGLLTPYGRDPEFYDLRADPLETRNLVAEHAALAGEYLELASRYREDLLKAVRMYQAVALDAGEEAGEMTDELEEALRSLGYLD